MVLPPPDLRFQSLLSSFTSMSHQSSLTKSKSFGGMSHQKIINIFFISLNYTILIVNILPFLSKVQLFQFLVFYLSFLLHFGTFIWSCVLVISDCELFLSQRGSTSLLQLEALKCLVDFFYESKCSLYSRAIEGRS